jgi:hypothetical protein
MLASWVGTPLAMAIGALSVSAFALALLVTVPSLRRLSAATASPEAARA